MTDLVLIAGAGMAAHRLAEELIRRGPLRRRVIMVGAEPAAPYNRVLLSPLLGGEIGAGDIALKPDGWLTANGVELISGTRVEHIDPLLKVATLSTGETIRYGTCVLATGSAPLRLPVPGADLPGVCTFRDTGDVARMAAAAEQGGAAVVIGGGLLGIEAACALARRGMAVTLLHIMDRLMERQLDAEAAGMLRDALEARGITVRLGAQTAAIRGDAAVEAVDLASGETIACCMVVMAAGVRPETSLAQRSGLAVRRGILVDDALATSSPGIYAIGECAEHRGACYGLVEPAHAQAAVLADRLTGGSAEYSGSVLATNLKVSGVPVFSAGDFEGKGAEAIILRDHGLGVYRKLVIRDGALTGAVLYGDTSDALWYFDLIKSGAPIAAIRGNLAFGQAYAEAA